MTSAAFLKVSKKAKIRNRYNQVPHLTQDTIWESVKNTQKQESQEASPFPAGDHKAVMNRQESMTNINNKMIHKEAPPWNGQYNIFTGELKLVLWLQPHSYFRCGSRQIDTNSVVDDLLFVVALIVLWRGLGPCFVMQFLVFFLVLQSSLRKREFLAVLQLFSCWCMAEICST